MYTATGMQRNMYTAVASTQQHMYTMTHVCTTHLNFQGTLDGVLAEKDGGVSPFWVGGVGYHACGHLLPLT